MFRVEVLFFMQIVTGVLMILVLHKMVQMKNKVEKVIQEVENYITFVTQEEEEQSMPMQAGEGVKTAKSKKENLDEAQTKLIQAVLGEYFL